MHRSKSYLAACIAAALAAPPVSAQQLEEIVVTARKRAESYQDVPVAVTAFDAMTIENAGIERPGDYLALTPNATLVQTQNQGTSFITVRGISQARNSEPSVAVLLDGVLMANPSQFNQDLFDIESIQVLKGPQGALYGRNAIGGAIIVETREPGDELEGSLRVGLDSGPGYKLQGTIGGPVGNSDTLKFRGAISYYDTDGFINNPYLHQEADPYRDISGRFKLLWQPNDSFSADLRLSASQVDTQALYFNITGSADDTSLPVRVNNPGVNTRDMYNVSLKVDYVTPGGTTFTSITSYDELEELLTGDQFDFLPIPESVLFQFFGADQAQHQFLDVQAWSQEFRLTSSAENRLRWIAGFYLISTDRFISTGNVFDLGTGTVPKVKRHPLPQFAPQWTYLADTQDNLAWAAFGELSYDLTDQIEASVALRYDHDKRKNTTETPAQFIPGPLVGIAAPGQVRTRIWDDLQPKFTLRYQPSDDLTWYGSYSRGFRSGGFNQTGVGAAGIAGIDDLFGQETADTFELGVKAQWLERRLSTNLNLFHTDAKGSYYFVFDPNTSTQNLGNLDKVRYLGLEFDATAVLFDGVTANAALGYTDSKIKASRRDPADVGNEAPLVSRYTLNLGLQYLRPIIGWDGTDLFMRADYQVIGPTWFYPDNYTTRNPVDLLDLRLGVQGETWSLTVWSKNLTDHTYNSEWSPGPMFFPSPGYTNNFVFKALPRRWGIDLTKRF